MKKLYLAALITISAVCIAIPARTAGEPNPAKKAVTQAVKQAQKAAAKQRKRAQKLAAKPEACRFWVLQGGGKTRKR